MTWLKYEFEELAPLVEQKKKESTFKITPIGGPDEIGKWREMQAAREHVYRMRLVNRDNRLTQIEADMGEKLATPKLSKADWAEKLSFATSERERLAQLEQRVREHPTWTRIIIPKQSLMRRLIQFLKNLWANSNF